MQHGFNLIPVFLFLIALWMENVGNTKSIACRRVQCIKQRVPSSGNNLKLWKPDACDATML
jgi:hypothetical protein